MYHQPDPSWLIRGDEPDWRPDIEYDFREDGLYDPDQEEDCD